MLFRSTTATRSVTLDGMDIWDGQTIGLVDRKLVAAGADPLDVLGQVLDRLAAPAGSLLTLYYGAGVTEAEAEATAAALRARPHPPEVDVVWGGQPHYAYLASLEV